jgi:hypothetical protein
VHDTRPGRPSQIRIDWETGWSNASRADEDARLLHTNNAEA